MYARIDKHYASRINLNIKRSTHLQDHRVAQKTDTLCFVCTT